MMTEYIEQNAADADYCVGGDKIKTHFATIIVGGRAEKPCYSILYFDPADRTYHIGYSSFNLEYVFKWLAEEFEIVEDVYAANMEMVPCHCKGCKYNIPEMALSPDGIWCNYWGTDPAPEDWCCKATPKEDI